MSAALVKIFFLNVILIVWKGNVRDALVVAAKCVPYLIGGFLYALYENPTVEGVKSRLLEVYLSRLCWDLIVSVYMG